MTPRSRRGGHELTAATLVGASAAGLALLAVGRTWDSVRLGAADVAPLVIAVSGTDAMPWLRAVALVALASVAAVLVTRNWSRAAVGALLTGCGAGLAWGAATAGPAVTETLRDRASASYASADADLVRDVLAREAQPGGWPVLLLCCGLVLSLIGAATAVRGHRWPVMGRRYERAQPIADPSDPLAVWRAQDEGRDPTR